MEYGNEDVLIDSLHGHHQGVTVVYLVDPESIERSHEEMRRNNGIVCNSWLMDRLANRLGNAVCVVPSEGMGVGNTHVGGILIQRCAVKVAFSVNCG